MTAGFQRHLAFAVFLAVAACNEQVVVEEPEIPGADQTEAIDEGPAEPAPPLYIGVWAADEGGCAVPPGEPGRIVFTDDRFLGYENACRITSSQEGTEGGWRLVMTCEAEGMTVEETADADVDGDRLRLSRNGGEPVEFIRCAGGQEK